MPVRVGNHLKGAERSDMGDVPYKPEDAPKGPSCGKVFFVVSVLVVLALFLFFSFLASRPRPPFDSARWKTLPPHLRAYHADDFLKEYENAIKSRTLTEKRLYLLLGPPESESDEWIYRMVEDDSLYLEVSFKQGKFDKALVFVTQPKVNSWRFPKQQPRFIPSAWKAAKPQRRLTMLSPLVKSRVLVGKTKPQVKKILGAPARTSGTRRVNYRLRDQNIGDDYLVFEIDDTGHVIRGEVVLVWPVDGPKVLVYDSLPLIGVPIPE